MPARRFPSPWSVEVVAGKKEAPLPGLKKLLVAEILSARAASAGLLARFRHVAPLFIHLFLLLAGLTGLLVLFLLLLARLLPAATLLATFAALLVLLYALIGHPVTPIQLLLAELSD
jgi:hypothetical protein